MKDVSKDNLVGKCPIESEHGFTPLTKINTNEFYRSGTREAERSKIALDSYMLYELKNKQFEIDELHNCLIDKIDKPEAKIRITADLLTNSKLANKMAKERKLPSNVIQAFNKVAYTIGNCCPTWNNPPSGAGVYNDTIWYKLNKHIIEWTTEAPISLNAREGDLMCLKRQSESKNPQMFSIFDDGISWENLISDLYLQDYFDNNWNLLDKKYTSIKKLKAEECIEYLKKTTVLIVQRGYRIATRYKRNILRPEDQKIIKNCLDKIGLEDSNCIYSEKSKKMRIME